MLTLIIGGSASGKSEMAETHVMGLDGTRVYLATMEARDEESRRRIRRHRERRADRGFETVESYRDVGETPLPENANVLLEDLGNLLANEMFSPGGGGAEAALAGVFRLAERCRHLTIVANEVFSDGSRYEGETWDYLRQMAWLHRRIAARADRVVEAVCGQPVVLKNEGRPDVQQWAEGSSKCG